MAERKVAAIEPPYNPIGDIISATKWILRRNQGTFLGPGVPGASNPDRAGTIHNQAQAMKESYPNLSATDIQAWVDPASYRKGESYFRQGAIIEPRRPII